MRWRNQPRTETTGELVWAIRPYWKMYSENAEEKRGPSGRNLPPQLSRNWGKRRMQPWHEVTMSRKVSRVRKFSASVRPVVVTMW